MTTQTESQSDPIADILRAAPASDRVRAAAWDMFYDSADPDDFAQRLKDLPLSDEVKVALREAKTGPRRPDPGVTAQTPEPQAGAVSRFVEAALRNNPITTGVDFLQQLVTDPRGAGQAVLEPSVQQLEQGVQAFREGRPLASAGHVLGAVPMVGPFVAENIQRAREGDAAGAAGALSWLALPAAKKAAPIVGSAVEAGVAKTARAVAPGLASRVADIADRSANERLGAFISPQTGPNKVRLGNSAVKVAPELLRDPELSAVTRGGLADKIRSRFDQAAEGLDTAADARLVSQQVKIGPVLAALDKQISNLTAHPVEGSRYPQTTRGTRITGAQERAGFGAAEMTAAEPIGQAVEPAPNSAQIATLRQIRQELAALGPVAPYESVRRIRQAWDQVAKVKFMPATAQDALKSMGDATGAASGTGAIREALAATDPASAKAYNSYNVYKTAQDVIQAAEEAERVRPNRGRGIMARTAGALIGAKEGGATGAAIGAIAAGIVDRAAELAPSHQVVVARRLAAVADALRSGDVPRAQAITDRIVHQFPAVRGGLKVVGKGAAMAGRTTLQTRLAAEKQQRDDDQ